MRYGVFSDVHGNLEALDAVFELFRQQEVGAWLCLGDLVGYGPNPNECIERVAALKRLQIVGGNHDFAVVGLKPMDRFQNFAARSLTWTKRHLKEENRNYLMRLPRLVEGSQFTLAHGSPRDPIDEYILTSRQYLDNLAHFRTSVCFVGHTHAAGVFMTDSLGIIQHRKLQEKETIMLDPQNKMIVNVGSVGQPRDGDPRAAAMVYDSDQGTVQIFRAEYNIESVQKKMRQASLPLFLIERLSYGR